MAPARHPGRLLKRELGFRKLSANRLALDLGGVRNSRNQAPALRFETMAKAKQLVVCIDNKGYAASLERRKIYVALHDAGAEKHDLLRIVDESAEDYLYPKTSFRSIALPQAVKKAVLAA